MVQPLWRTAWRFLKKLNIELPYDPAMPAHISEEKHNSKRYMHPRDFPGGAVVKNLLAGAFLVAQWLRICLPMQGTRVRALVWEDPTCRGATGPVSHDY